MPSFDVEDTIAAIASAYGSSLRGIIRISGPACVSCLQNVFVPTDEHCDIRRFKSPTILRGNIRLPDSQQLPGELLLWPTRRSYTRQPAAEFHTIGSMPLLKMALSTICQSGARLANPGEFTLRAFLSGRLDLTQAEAVLAIIDAGSDSQLKGALKQLSGGLTGPLTDARDQLTFVLAELEAGLDFAEEDIEFISQAELMDRLETVATTIKSITNQIDSRHLESDLIRVALVGLPNAGKSSLFNRLLGSNRAIVTHIAGTTTDFLAAPLEIAGQRIEIIDTAGQESLSSSGEVANQAQQQRDFIVANSQIQILCIDPSHEMTKWEIEQLDNLNDSTIVVQTKSDLLPLEHGNIIRFSHLPAGIRFVATSSTQSTGIIELLDVIRVLSVSLGNAESQIVGSTVLRAADCLRAAEQSLDLALLAATDQAGDEIVAAEIRQSLDQLGRVVGTVYTDDILDVVFSRFCIGK